MTIETRQPVHPEHFRGMDSTSLAETFLIPRVFYPGEARFTYTLFDRMIVGGVEPVSAPIILETDPALATPPRPTSGRSGSTSTRRSSKVRNWRWA
jgi:5-keto 4-deoxyuronate isomerase